jgi:hypothetical protein
MIRSGGNKFGWGIITGRQLTVTAVTVITVVTVITSVTVITVLLFLLLFLLKRKYESKFLQTQ